MENILSSENLTVGYDKRNVVSGIDIKAARGQIICLLGANGAGKSTVLRTLSGLLAPVSGAVYVGGKNVREIKSGKLARRLSLVLTEQPAPSLTTVYELTAMGRTPYTDFLGRLSDDDRRIIDEALEQTGSLSLKDRFFSELSDGEKQKVMISRALAQQPELIILDEPTSHLDIKHKIEIMRILQRLANEKGITCVLSLHDIDLALKCCSVVMLVKDGKIAACGAPEDIAEKGIIDGLYGIENASFFETTGAVELKGADRNDVFVVGGGGAATPLLRNLARLGCGLTCGIIHENDVDFSAVKTICSAAAYEKSFKNISREAVSEAQLLISEANCVIDGGFPVGDINAACVQLIGYAAALGKPVLSLRSAEECTRLFGSISLRRFDRISEAAAAAMLIK